MTTVTLRPRYEGANIRTWVGFKHFMYLAEEAVLQWFRDRGFGPTQLYHEHGLGLEIVDSSVQLPAVLDVDDTVTAEVTETSPGAFSVRLSVERAGAPVGVLRGKVKVALIVERDAPGSAPPPAELAGLVTGGVRGEPDDPPPPGPGAFEWSWRIPYFYCHYSDRLQHSGYVRVLEEVVDRFLADRGRAVGRMLAERAWIPVVSRARIRMLADAHMEETVHTRFVVTDVYRNLTYDARMDCFVRRDGDQVHTATARILHGYAISRGPGAGGLAELDPATVAALTTGERP